MLRLVTPIGRYFNLREVTNRQVTMYQHLMHTSLVEKYNSTYASYFDDNESAGDQNHANR